MLRNKSQRKTNTMWASKYVKYKKQKLWTRYRERGGNGEWVKWVKTIQQIQTSSYKHKVMGCNVQHERDYSLIIILYGIFKSCFREDLTSSHEGAKVIIYVEMHIN